MTIMRVALGLMVFVLAVLVLGQAAGRAAPLAILGMGLIAILGLFKTYLNRRN